MPDRRPRSRKRQSELAYSSLDLRAGEIVAEIDRNRKVYDKRVAPTVAARIDYFYDELVQTLAEGDPAKLGKDCPGPVAVA